MTADVLRRSARVPAPGRRLGAARGRRARTPTAVTRQGSSRWPGRRTVSGAHPQPRRLAGVFLSDGPVLLPTYRSRRRVTTMPTDQTTDAADRRAAGRVRRRGQSTVLRAPGAAAALPGGAGRPAGGRARRPCLVMVGQAAEPRWPERRAGVLTAGTWPRAGVHAAESTLAGCRLLPAGTRSGGYPVRHGSRPTMQVRLAEHTSGWAAPRPTRCGSGRPAETAGETSRSGTVGCVRRGRPGHDGTDPGRRQAGPGAPSLSGRCERDPASSGVTDVERAAAADLPGRRGSGAGRRGGLHHCWSDLAPGNSCILG